MGGVSSLNLPRDTDGYEVKDGVTYQIWTSIDGRENDVMYPGP